jgi:cytochrome P450
MTTSPVADWMDPAELVRDPYPAYARLRRESPVAWAPFLDSFVATTYDASRFVKMNPDVFTAESGGTTMRRTMQRHSMIDVDDPQHATERAPVNAVLRPKAIKENWTETFEANTRHYLDLLADAGPDKADLNALVASPLATKNLIDLLGVRGVDVDVVRNWSATLMEGLSNVTDDQAVWAKVDAVREQVDAHLAEMIPYYRKHPDNTFTSALVAGGLPDEAVAANVRLANTGGINEPQHAVTSIVWALTEHPDQRRAVLADQGLWPEVFEQTLRWISPLGYLPRHARNDIVLEGVHIPKGSTVAVLIASANREEGIFANADTFDIRRPKLTNFTFGAGVHMCAGMWAARWSIGSIEMPMLYRRFEGLRTAEDREATWSGFVTRGLQTHPVIRDKDRGEN